MKFLKRGRNGLTTEEPALLWSLVTSALFQNVTL